MNQAIKDEIKPNFKVIDNVISDKHVESFIECEYKPNKVQSHLTNMIVYDMNTFNTIKCVPYSNCMYGLSKISGKNNRDITERRFQKCLVDCIFFEGLNNINEIIDYILQFKREAKKLITKLLKVIYT